MSDQDERRRAAQAIINVPFFTELFDEIERTAMNQCIHADINDDETRRNAAAEVRAIRKVRSRLVSTAEEASETRKAPV